MEEISRRLFYIYIGIGSITRDGKLLPFFVSIFLFCFFCLRELVAQTRLLSSPFKVY